MSAFPWESRLPVFREENHVAERGRGKKNWSTAVSGASGFAGCREGPRPVGARRRHSLLGGMAVVGRGWLHALHVYVRVLARVFTCNEHSGLMLRLWALGVGRFACGKQGRSKSFPLFGAMHKPWRSLRGSGSGVGIKRWVGADGMQGLGGVSSDVETNPFFAYLRLTPPGSLSPPPDKSN